MGLFDGIIGGIVGAEMATVVHGIIEKHGGLSGVVDQFQQQGLGPTIKSWISTGENDPITPAQVQSALGSQTLADLAAKVGMTPEELSARLTSVLPQAIDKMTPAGTLPSQ